MDKLILDLIFRILTARFARKLDEKDYLALVDFLETRQVKGRLD